MMKPGIVVIVLAIALASFIKAGKKEVTYYWFYNAAGTNLVYPTTVPPTSLPVACAGPQQINCIIGYTSYVLDGAAYKPSGTFIILYKRAL